MFSGKLFLNVPTELRESWDRKDLSLPLAPKLPILPELSEPFRRSVEGTLPLSDDSTSSVKKLRTKNMVVPRCFLNFPTDRLFPNWLAFLENQRKDAGYSEVIQKVDSKGEKELLHLVSNFLQGRFTEAQ